MAFRGAGAVQRGSWSVHLCRGLCERTAPAQVTRPRPLELVWCFGLSKKGCIAKQLYALFASTSAPSRGFFPILRPRSSSEGISGPACRAVDSTMHCDLGFEETTEEFSYLADADCSVAFKFPLPPRSAVFRCGH